MCKNICKFAHLWSDACIAKTEETNIRGLCRLIQKTQIFDSEKMKPAQIHEQILFHLKFSNFSKY